MTLIVDVLQQKVSNRLSSGSTRVIGVSGPQGSGKSTACRQLQEQLGDACAVLSLDDFYLPKADRIRLSQQCSPLFEVRGPPGTHSITLLRETLERLKNMSSSDVVLTPVFSKLHDDREPIDIWRKTTSRPDVIIIEGWCVGAQHVPDYNEIRPLNAVEHADKNQNWLTYQSRQLGTLYRELWGEIDEFFHLQAPDFETVLDWRTEQEATNQNVSLKDLSDERKDWVSGFLQHYERITRAMAEGRRVPGTVLQLSAEREVISVERC